LLRATFAGYVDDGPTGDTLPVVAEWSSQAATGKIDILTLPTNTDVTLSVPTGTVLIGLFPPAANGVDYVIKGAGGDTGTSKRREMPSFESYGGGTVILRAVSPGITGFTVVYL
jgi:hypothetical protein